MVNYHSCNTVQRFTQGTSHWRVGTNDFQITRHDANRQLHNLVSKKEDGSIVLSVYTDYHHGNCAINVTLIHIEMMFS